MGYFQCLKSSEMAHTEKCFLYSWRLTSNHIDSEKRESLKIYEDTIDGFTKSPNKIDPLVHLIQLF